MTYFYKNIVILLALLCLPTQNLIAQNYEGWIDYNPYYKLSENTQLFGEVGFRTQLKNVKNRQYIASVDISHKYTDWIEILGGIRDFYTDLNLGLSTNELRTWLGGKFRFSGPWKTKMYNYFRSEYRHIRIIDYQTETSFRFRNQLGLTFSIWSDLNEESNLSGIIDVEVFADTKDGLIETFAEKVRFRLGLGYYWIKSLRFELFYTAQRAGKDIFEINDHILRFQIKHTLN